MVQVACIEYLLLDLEVVGLKPSQSVFEPPHDKTYIKPCPADLGYALPLQIVQIQISWLLKKPTDLDLNYLQFSI